MSQETPEAPPEAPPARREPPARPRRRAALESCPNADAHLLRHGLDWRPLPGEGGDAVGECSTCLRTVRVLPARAVGLVETLAPSGPSAVPHDIGRATSRARITCEGPRFPVDDPAGYVHGGAVGGACWMAPLAFWCAPCLSSLRDVLAAAP